VNTPVSRRGTCALLAVALPLLACGCRQLVARPATPTYAPTPYAPYTPSVPYAPAQPVAPTPDPGFGAPAYGGGLQPPGVDEQIDRRVPTPVDPPTEPTPTDDGLTGPTLAPPRDSGLGPTLAPRKIIVPANVELTVTADAYHAVGDPIAFEITLRNTGDEPATAVEVEAEFDTALAFPGRADHRVKRSIGPLAAGASETVSLTLTADKAGTHCARFTVTGDGLPAVTKQMCVVCAESSAP
jgi:uncharacterized repeat protein (TIGR01451 family)